MEKDQISKLFEGLELDPEVFNDSTILLYELQLF